MARADYLSEYSRGVIYIIKITLDKCQESFGVAPCTATGVQCYNTFSTCKDTPNYNRGTTDIYLSSISKRIPFAGCRPLLLNNPSIFQTDISDNKLKTLRFTFDLAEDFKDYDIGMDPYRSSRATKPDTVPFVKTLLARNPNWQNRPITIYEGFDGQTQTQLLDDENIIAYGILKNIRLGDKSIQFEATDIISPLSEIDYPEKKGVTLVSDISTSQTSIVLSDVDGYEDYTALSIGEEIITYDTGNISAANNMITSCVRAAGGTTAAAHSSGDSAEPCGYFQGDIFDVLKDDILIGAGGLVSGNIASDWNTIRDNPTEIFEIEAYLPKSTKLNKYIQELIDLFCLKMWQGEDQKIHITRSHQNLNGRTYHILTDNANIVVDSRASDLNDDDRITTVEIRYDFDWFGSIDKAEDFSGFEIQHDSDAAGINGAQKIKKKIIPCRWLRRGVYQEELFFDFIEALARRTLFKYNEAHAFIEAKVEIKDSAITAGDFAKLTTTALVDETGTPLEAEKFEICKRKPDKNVLSIKMLRCIKTPFLIIAPDSVTNDWSTATDSEKEYGAICNDNGEMSDGAPGSVIYAG